MNNSSLLTDNNGNSLQFMMFCATMRTCLTSIKGGYNACDGRLLNCRGGSTKAPTPSRYGHSVTPLRGDAWLQSWGFVAHQPHRVETVYGEQAQQEEIRQVGWLCQQHQDYHLSVSRPQVIILSDAALCVIMPRQAGQCKVSRSLSCFL